MPQESSLLAYLVPRLTSRVEDTATDALAFILSKSPACRGVLGLLLREGEESYHFDALTSFDTQVTYEVGKIYRRRALDVDRNDASHHFRLVSFQRDLMGWPL